jgi:hypothetical protein
MKKNNFTPRLPASLGNFVGNVAADDGTTINQFIVGAVAEKLSALKTAGFFAERAAKADFDTFDRVMARKTGEQPQPGDEIPESYRRPRRRK